MALRRYTRAEFEEELQSKWNLTPTDVRTATAMIWRTPNGQHLSVPCTPDDEGRIPGYYIDLVAQRLNELGENPFATP